MQGYRYRGRTRTCTRAGRAGVASERKSRTGALWWQNGQSSACAGDTVRPPRLTGASQRGQASVPLPSRHERASRRSSCAPARSEIGRGFLLRTAKAFWPQGTWLGATIGANADTLVVTGALSLCGLSGIEAIEFLLREVPISPLWLCPLRTRPTSGAGRRPTAIRIRCSRMRSLH